MIYSTGRTGLGLHPGENLKGSGLRVEFKYNETYRQLWIIYFALAILDLKED